MYPMKKFTIRSYEAGLFFYDGEFKGVLFAGKHRFWDWSNKVKVEVVSQRAPWLLHEKLDVIVKSGALAGHAEVVDLRDHQRALVWVDGRFSHVLPPGLYAYWTTHRTVKIEIVDASQVRFEHAEASVIARSQMAGRLLESVVIPSNHVGVYFLDDKFVEILPAGVWYFWKDRQKAWVETVDLRETLVDVSSQDILTADKVTLRINAHATYRVIDAKQSLSVVHDVRQALYREGQLALRAIVGARDLDGLLADKESVTKDLADAMRSRGANFGVEIVQVGVRDLILPGDMKNLMNKVMEAKKAAEANLIARREETAAMRSQANTAKLLEGNPTLMRLRELEALEKVAQTGKLRVILGDKGLAERLANLV